MNGDDLAKAIFDAVNGADPNDASSNIAINYQRAIGDYLADNIEVEGAFAGASTSTPPVPYACTVKAKVTFPTFIFLPAPDNLTFHLNLANAMKLGIITYLECESPSDAIAATPTSFLPAGFFLNIFPSTFDAEENDVMAYMKAYCGNIVDQIKSNFQAMPAAATVTSAGVPYIGTVTFTSIK